MSACNAEIVSLSERNTPRSNSSFLGLIGTVLCVWGGLQLEPVLLRDVQLRDFLQEWTSARNWRAGRPVYQDMAESIPFHIRNARAGDLHFNPHPPVAVAIALPFGALEYRASLLAWNIFSLLAIVLAVDLLIGQFGYSLSRSERLFVAGVVLSSSVLRSQVLYGQLNGVLLLLLVGAWLGVRHQSWSWAGFCVGLAASIKLFPGFLVLFFAARCRSRSLEISDASCDARPKSHDFGYRAMNNPCLRALLVAGVTFVTANLVAMGLLGSDAFRDYVTIVMPQAGHFCDTWPNASLLGFLSRLFDGSFGHVTPLWRSPILAKGLWLLFAAVAVVMTWQATRRANSPKADDLAFATWTCLMLLASPITWDHYFLLAIPALMALWRDDSSSIPKSRLFLLGVTVILVILSPYAIWRFLVPNFTKLGMTPMTGTPWQLLTMISLQFYVCAALYFACLRRVRCSVIR